jgi:acetylornithine aminotransferase
MIADEIQCGYGRSGKFFAVDHAGINADIYTMAKGMANGFPIGGILIAPHIQPKHGMLGTTFGGTHLACAAALGVVEVMKDENLVKHANEVGTYLINELKKINAIKNVRGEGLMIGFDVPDEIKTLRKHLLFEHQIFTGESKPNVIRLLPALSIGKKEVDDFLSALKESVQELSSEQKVQVSDGAVSATGSTKV